MGVCDGERKSACARCIDLSMIYLKIAIEISTLHATKLWSGLLQPTSTMCASEYMSHPGDFFLSLGTYSYEPLNQNIKGEGGRRYNMIIFIAHFQALQTF